MRFSLSLEPGPLRATVVLLFGVVCIGFSGIFTRAADAPGVVVAAWRLGLAAAVMTVPFARQTPKHHRRLTPILLSWAVLGGVFFAVDIGLWNAALDTTTAASTTFLGNIAPVWVGLFTLIVLRQRLPRFYWLSVMLALGGAGLMIFGGELGAGALKGDLMAVGASFFWAGYQMVTARIRPRMSNASYVLIMNVTAFAILLPVSLLSGFTMTGYDQETGLIILAATVVSQLGGFISVNYALGYLPAVRATIILLLQPVVAAVAGVLLLHEPFGGWRLVGGVLILAGVYLVIRLPAQARAQSTTTAVPASTGD